MATAKLALQVEHNNAEDVLLDMSQLHSAKLLQVFQPMERYPDLPQEAVIRRAIINHSTLARQEEYLYIAALVPGEESPAPTVGRKRACKTMSIHGNKRGRGHVEAAVVVPVASDVVGPSRTTTAWGFEATSGEFQVAGYQHGAI